MGRLICPPGCAPKQDAPVFGPSDTDSTDLVKAYDADSSICRAAIHMGVIDKDGADVNFTILPGKKF